MIQRLKIVLKKHFFWLCKSIFIYIYIYESVWCSVIAQGDGCGTDSAESCCLS